ncbi:MAG: thioredoxin family protein [Deltaproteobacteria bacterium]|nr:thioredoxin family protein [Deltaproteobacteria bacterium]
MTMRIRSVRVFLTVVTVLAMAVASAFAAEPGAAPDDPTKPHVRAEMIADVDAVVPGAPLRLGARFDIDPEWHVYWQNPGDAGIPTEAKFVAPEGFTLAPTRYPAPEFFGAGTPLAGYGYEKEVVLFVDAVAPAQTAEAKVTFKAETSWLVCRHTCIPGSANVELTLPVKAAAGASKHVPLLQAAAASVPVTLDTLAGFDVKGTLSEERIAADRDFSAKFVVTAPPGATIAPLAAANRPFLIPGPMTGYEVTSVEPDAKPGEAKNAVAATIMAKTFPGEGADERIGGVFQFRLTDAAGSRDIALYHDMPLPRGTAAAPAPSAAPVAPIAPAAPAPLARVALMLAFALIGGVILNIMPCVLPVISIKIFSLVKHADYTRAEIRRHGLAYTGGIVLSFVVLATVVAALKSSGEAVGWGFQFQSPLFVALLAAFVFVFALSMLGVFEIVGPGRAVEKAERVAEHATKKIVKATLHAEADTSGEGVAGSFLSGIFATVLATPCTAPFLGAALGFAFTQPLPFIFATFVMVGLGLALPFLLLAFVPAWTRFLPRPGDWMNTFKAIMGFLLVATVVWLLDVLGQQVGPSGLTRVIGYLALLSVSVWIWGRWGNLMRTNSVRLRAAAIAAAIAVAGAFLLHFEPFAMAGSDAFDGDGIAWQKFSEEKVDQLVASGKPVFIDFTAAWCWTCKVNEKAVIETDEIRAALEKHGFAALKGDWTNKDPAITAYLKRHGRAGVPMYVVISPKSPDAPNVLPEVITKDMVLTALAAAAGG